MLSTLHQALDERYGFLPICPTCKQKQIHPDECVSCRLLSNEESPYRQIGGDTHPPRETSDFSHD